MFRRIDLLTGILIVACALTTWLVDVPDAAVTQIKWWQGEFWRVVPSTLLHANWWHLLVNCLSLYFVGTVVAKGLGWPVYLGAVVLGAFAGFGASLLAIPQAMEPNAVYRVGISGSVAGLVGLILAVEWRNSRSVLEFLAQRNTILIMFFIALSVGLAIYIERKHEGVRVDHAAHIGGAAACLIAGLVYYGRRREHPVRGLAAVAVLGLVPLALAAYPIWDTGFCIWKAGRAAPDDAGGWWERAYELDPTNPRAAAQMAIRRDDSALLETMREPRGTAEKKPVVDAYLFLAKRRLESDPDAAEDLLEKAGELDPERVVVACLSLAADRLETASPLATRLIERAKLLRPAPHEAWARFAGMAGQAGRTDLYYEALRMALALARGEQADRTTLQKYAQGLVPALEQEVIAAVRGEREDRLAIALDAVNTVDVLARKLSEPDLDQRMAAALERMTTRMLGRIGILERESSLDGDPVRLRELRTKLHAVWDFLAENERIEGTALGANCLYRSAYWWELQVKGTEFEARDRQAIANRVERALREARSYGAPETEKLAAQWFRDHKLPVPTGDLADLPDGG